MLNTGKNEVYIVVALIDERDAKTEFKAMSNLHTVKSLMDSRPNKAHKQLADQIFHIQLVHSMEEGSEFAQYLDEKKPDCEMRVILGKEKFLAFSEALKQGIIRLEGGHNAI